MSSKDKVRILNLGCGKDTYGTDFVDIYLSRKEVIRCNIDKESLPYGDGTFDEVQLLICKHNQKEQSISSCCDKGCSTGGPEASSPYKGNCNEMIV